MRTAPVFRTIDRQSRLLGLEYFDCFVWLGSITILKSWHLYGLGLSLVVWGALFALRFRRPPGFLFNLIRFHARCAFNLGRFSAASNERERKPWLSLRRE